MTVNIIAPDHLKNKGLPKWPQMVVSGEPVGVTNAKEIIRRTDRFFVDFSDYAGGNNRTWNKWANKKLFKHLLDDDNISPHEVYVRQEVFAKRWGHIETEFVSNDWASCAFIGGPHGWCHPDGQIGFLDNIGKYPSVENVMQEWAAILEAFPFLNIRVTLMNGERHEEGDIRPVVSMIVRDNTVELTDNHDIHEYRIEDTELSIEQRFFHPEGGEQGLPKEWIVDFGKIAEPLHLQGYAEVDFPKKKVPQLKKV